MKRKLITVLLLGMLTQSEAAAAIQVARTTSGVRKVVPLFEILTPSQARELDAGRRTEDREQKTEKHSARFFLPRPARSVANLSVFYPLELSSVKELH
jgi:hypothetical protein